MKNEDKSSSDLLKVAGISAPPQAIDAEKSVLGCLFLDKDSLIKIVDILIKEDFYHDHHQFIYEACLDLFHRSEPIDIVTVSTKLQEKNKLEIIGGPEYLAEIQNIVPIATHIFQYAQIVKHRSTLRSLISAGTEIAALGQNMEKSVEELLESAEKRVFAISKTFIRDRFVNIKEVLSSSYERWAEINENPDLAHRNRTSTFFHDLDDKLNGGFNPSDLIIVAARPSMGKTALSLSIAQNIALQENHDGQKKNVGIISLEMSKEQLVERMFCSQLGIESWKLHKGKLDEQDFEKLGPVMDKLGSCSIYIDDSMGSSIVELRAKARRLQMEHGLDLLVVDYLQLMSSSSHNPANRVQEISEISRSLKEIARELHIPIIALSQLSRSVEARENKRPVMSDLRDSGSIEQDADIVMMLYREEYYNQECPPEKENILEINIIKHRNGATGQFFLHFDRQKQKIKNHNPHQAMPSNEFAPV